MTLDCEDYDGPFYHRCKCCRAYFMFEELDENGCCPECHGYVPKYDDPKITGELVECDDTEVMD